MLALQFSLILAGTLLTLNKLRPLIVHSMVKKKDKHAMGRIMSTHEANVQLF